MQARADKIDHYADALIALGRAAGALQTIEHDVIHLLDFVREHEDLQRFLDSETVANEGKRRAIHEILKRHTHPVLVDFLIMLVSAGDLPLLHGISERFLEKAAEVHACVSGEVQVAKPLSDTHLAEIEAEVGRILDKQVSLRPRVMPGILGGVLVKVGDFILDGTLERQLNDAKRQLLA